MLNCSLALLHVPIFRLREGATRCNINGTTNTDFSPTEDVPNDPHTEIRSFLISAETGLKGSYYVQFYNGFPFNTICDKDEPEIPSPSINFI
jgi:hypothetical protein